MKCTTCAFCVYGKVAVLNASWATQASTLYSNEVLYAGYRLDPETGLYQVRHRAYHSTMGRWLQRDPAGYHDGPSLYEYVTGNPVNRLDPTGLNALGSTLVSYPVGLTQQLAWNTYGTAGAVAIYAAHGIQMTPTTWVGPNSTPAGQQGGGIWGGVGGGLPPQPGPAPQDKLDRVINEATNLLAQAVNDLMSVNLLLMEPWQRFALWFGDPNEPERVQFAWRVYYASFLEIKKPNFRLAHINEKGKGGSYASTTGVLPANYTIHLDTLWSTRDGAAPPSSQAGILIHELAHAVEWKVNDYGPKVKQYKEPADMLAWKVWAMTKGRPFDAHSGGDGFTVADTLGKLKDANCYKYFAEKQR